MEHTLPVDCKIVFDGKNIANDEPLRIVRNGRYTLDKEGLEAAILDGQQDKHGFEAEIFDFDVIAIEDKPSKGNIIVKSVVLRRVAHNGRDTLGTFVAEVRCRLYTE